jgi:hypothetical protein
LDESPEQEKKRKRKVMKLILLHLCETGALIAINPEVLLEIGNKLGDEIEPHEDAKVKILQSQVISGATHDAHLFLEKRPFKVGQTIKFTGLTRVHQLNNVEVKITSTISTTASGWQVVLGPGPLELTAHNRSTTLSVLALAAETGDVFVPEREILCGFLACCCSPTSGGEDSGSSSKVIETRESMQEILELLVTAGIATIHDPEGHLFVPPETDRP